MACNASGRARVGRHARPTVFRSMNATSPGLAPSSCHSKTAPTQLAKRLASRGHGAGRRSSTATPAAVARFPGRCTRRLSGRGTPSTRPIAVCLRNRTRCKRASTRWRRNSRLGCRRCRSRTARGAARIARIQNVATTSLAMSTSQVATASPATRSRTTSRVAGRTRPTRLGRALGLAVVAFTGLSHRLAPRWRFRARPCTACQW
mmetsp:Transcript_66155/g.191680  ORF Transcript_66155/g.191680 Transcript_66155/m.191680 type:complete len:205 (+) Transcript_66155:626-1240(+)